MVFKFNAEHHIKESIAEKMCVEIDNVTFSADLAGDLNVNALDLAELTYAFKKDFNIRIPDEMTSKVAIVQDLIGFIKELKM